MRAHTTVGDYVRRAKAAGLDRWPLPIGMMPLSRHVLLANVYLHYVFDLWVEAWRKKVAKGDVIVVRYADDLLVGFEHRREAQLFLAEFRERLAKFGLELHADKTRLMEFGRFAAQDRKRSGEGNRTLSRNDRRNVILGTGSRPPG